MSTKSTTHDATLTWSKCVECGVIFSAHKKMNHVFVSEWKPKGEIPNAFVQMARKEEEMENGKVPEIHDKLVEFAVETRTAYGRRERPFVSVDQASGSVSYTKNDDPVNHPSHYTSSGAKCTCGRTIECIDVVRHLGFNRGNAIKYLWRAGKKDATIQDLKKAIWYINDEIRKLEESDE